MNILVTGGGGFIGSHLVDALLARDHKVFIVDTLAAHGEQHVNPAATLLKIDLGDESLASLVTSNKIEVVFHLAAQVDVRKSVADPQYDATQNILGSLNLFEACRAAGVSKIIFSSSGGAVYGTTDTVPTPEAEIEHPISPYGVAKLAIEKYLHYYHAVHGMQYVTLRYANVYGPRQGGAGEAGVIAIFCEKVLAGTTPTINGDGGQTRDFVYVGDVVNANLLALDCKTPGPFNIGTGIETNMNELSLLVTKAAGATMDFNHGPAKLGEQRRSALDPTRAKKDLSWQPTVDLAQGIGETLKYFKKKSSGA